MDLASVQIFLKTPKGRTIQVEAHLGLFTRHLKQTISEALGSDQNLLPSQQILMFSGQRLDDHKKLSDYNLQQDSTVVLVEKPPSQDPLNFDRCHVCLFSLIDPLVLPCGHTCCRCCLDIEVVACPVLNCGSSLNGVPRDHLPQNWVASQTWETLSPTQSESVLPLCQICEEAGVKEKATQWCNLCSQTPSCPEFYCDQCSVAEHSQRLTRGHTRAPIDQKPRIPKFTECPKHHLPQDFFCHPSSQFLCSACSQDDTHREHFDTHSSHTAQSRRAELKALLNILKDASTKQDSQYIQQIAITQAEILPLEARLAELKASLESLQAEFQQVQETTRTRDAALLVLAKTIQDFPFNDFFINLTKRDLLIARMNELRALWNPNPQVQVQVQLSDDEGYLDLF